VPLLTCGRIFEDDLHSVIDARTESLQTLRELGPPDLAQLVKIPIKGAQKQVWSTRSGMPSLVLNRQQQGVYHHVTGIDASSSASLAAYINTLTYAPYDKANKVVSGLYWYVFLQQI
jgi:hypothetical protein